MAKTKIGSAINQIGHMMALAELGVTPDEYQLFYNLYVANVSEFDESFADEDNAPDSLITPFWNRERRYPPVKEYSPMPYAHEHTLRLKIQMKDVTKPPMWREITIPADFNFELLHLAIQDVMGLENCHLWQFNKKAYQDSLVIGMTEDEYGNPGVSSATHDAEKTPLTLFLQHKGDTLEYVYDFGDDWIFTVEVKEVIDKPTEFPVCTKFKGDLNAIEDIGGVWGYIDARDTFARWDDISPKGRKRIADDRMFDTPQAYYNFLCSHLFNLEETNETLEGITR